MPKSKEPEARCFKSGSLLIPLAEDKRSEIEEISEEDDELIKTYICPKCDAFYEVSQGNKEF